MVVVARMRWLFVGLLRRFVLLIAVQEAATDDSEDFCPLPACLLGCSHQEKAVALTTASSAIPPVLTWRRASPPTTRRGPAYDLLFTQPILHATVPSHSAAAVLFLFYYIPRTRATY